MAGRGGNVMSSRSGSGSATDSLNSPVAASEEQKPGKKRRTAFCLARMKSRNRSGKQLQHQPAANNNNTPFMIHCQIGKEIKHICSNCRGAEPLDGERTRRSDLQERGERKRRGRSAVFRSLLSSVGDRSLPAPCKAASLPPSLPPSLLPASLIASCLLPPASLIASLLPASLLPASCLPHCLPLCLLPPPLSPCLSVCFEAGSLTEGMSPCSVSPSPLTHSWGVRLHQQDTYYTIICDR
ncbi:hypothetical protein PAMA_001010 [Pampus argenteus]